MATKIDSKNASFGAWLIRRMHSLGLTNEFLSRQLGVNVLSLTCWRQNRSKPVGNKVERLAILLGITELELRARIAGSLDSQPIAAGAA